MTDIGDIVELKNVLGHSLASAELVAGTGGVSVLSRLSTIESGTNLQEIKNAIGFDSMPAEWKTGDTPNLYLELYGPGTYNFQARITALEDVVRTLMLKLYGTDVPEALEAM